MGEYNCEMLREYFLHASLETRIFFALYTIIIMAAASQLLIYWPHHPKIAAYGPVILISC